MRKREGWRLRKREGGTDGREREREVEKEEGREGMKETVVGEDWRF